MRVRPLMLQLDVECRVYISDEIVTFSKFSSRIQKRFWKSLLDLKLHETTKSKGEGGEIAKPFQNWPKGLIFIETIYLRRVAVALSEMFSK